MRKTVSLAGGFKERASREKLNIIRDDDPTQTSKCVDLNAPVFRRMLQRAPGTDTHSIAVANLSESACEAIGANAVLVYDVADATSPRLRQAVRTEGWVSGVEVEGSTAWLPAGPRGVITVPLAP